MSVVIETLLSSPEPAIRLKTRYYILGEPLDSPEQAGLQKELACSERVNSLLRLCRAGENVKHPYAKWDGAHWVLAALAEMLYPSGDRSLLPFMEQCYDWLLSPHHMKYIQNINGLTRRCASQEGYALYYSLALGLADDRSEELAHRLMGWQWPDGGWNCDKRPEACHSSFMETLIPMRALALYSRRSGDSHAAKAVERAAEVFLRHRLFRRTRDGEVIHPDFLKLFYPWYWRYSALAGLRGMADAGFIDDPRCQPALEWLASRQLPGGGFPADIKFYRVSDREPSGRSPVGWGSVRKTAMNEFVTVEALSILQMSKFKIE